MLQLRPFQKRALEILRRDSAHLICVAPTGSGKSLIYERMVEAPGTKSLLITPLTALARQQKERLEKLGVKAVLGTGARDAPFKNRLPPEPSGVWIVSPEMLQGEPWSGIAEKWKPSFLIVDECHCFWDWGEGFRPAFSNLPDWLEKLGIKKSVWLTATLPSEARRELKSRLPDSVKEIGGFDLPESLHFSVLRTKWRTRLDHLIAFTLERKSPGIVFAWTRQGTERLARTLKEAGVPVVTYHAGLGLEERRNIEERLSSGQTLVVVATSAFGMGMDFRHLKWVVLWQAPPSLLALAQAVGRVGRAGSAGSAVLFWDEEDFRLLEWMIQGSDRKRQEFQQVYRFLHATGCHLQNLKNYFEENPHSACRHRCSRCSPRWELPKWV